MRIFFCFLIFVLVFIYLLLPKILLVEIRVEKSVFVKIMYNLLGIYVQVYYKQVQNSDYKKDKKFLIVKKHKKKKLKYISFNKIFNVAKVFLSSAIVKVEKICARIYCADAFILSILSASIYSIWGILISCGQNTIIDYKAFCQQNFLSSNLQLNICVKIFPAKLLINWYKVIKKQKGGAKLGSSN